MTFGKMKENFDANAKTIKMKHFSQTVEQIQALNEKYNKPVFGTVSPWSLIEKLAQAVDPTDRELYCTSQWIHTWQVLEAMEHIKDEEFLLAAILHDVGKILLTTNELPENIVCDNGLVVANIGLDNCILHWNHDEFGYMKFKNLVPYHVSWLIRYHSIRSDVLVHMDHKDKILKDKYFDQFKKYDKSTKSIYHLPKVNIDKYRRLVEKHLPPTMEF